MSIIEKAVDKLISDKPVVKQERPPAASTESQDKGGKRPGVKPETDSPQSAPAGAPADKTATGQAIKPDICLQTLNLDEVITAQSKRMRLAEEMRMIKRPILLNAFGKGKKRSDHSNMVMITSAVAGEGKTFTALNLALSIAMEMDRTVLLVDADLARPGLSRLLKKSDRPGLTDHLLGDKRNVGELFLRTDVPKLTILPAGRPHAHSTELLASNSMKCLFDELAERYHDRIVLFDSPPLLVTSEASVLAGFMGQIVLVVESAVTPQYLVKEAVAQLDSTDNVSLILNKCKKDFFSTRMVGYGYDYGYGYGYGEGYGKEGDG